MSDFTSLGLTDAMGKLREERETADRIKALEAEAERLRALLLRLYLAAEDTIKYAAQASDRKPWVDTLHELCSAGIEARDALGIEARAALGEEAQDGE